MYRLFFYCIYRTSLIRGGDAVFIGVVLTYMLLVGHVAILFSLVEILIYQIFHYSFRGQSIVDGRILVGICGILGFILVYKYFNRKVESIISEYENRYSRTSHWKGSIVCSLLLYLNTALTVFALVLSRKVLGLDG